jgi:hypothetical protein
MRPNMSNSRSACLIAWAMALSASSPQTWPNRSLIVLK